MTNQQKILLMRVLNLRMQLLQYENVQIAGLSALFRKAVSDITSLLERVNLTTVAQLNSAIKAIEKGIARMDAATAEYILNMSANSGNYTSVELNKILSWDNKAPDFTTVVQSTVELIEVGANTPIGGKVLSEWLSGVAGIDLSAVRGVVQKGIKDGTGIAAITRELRGVLKDTTDVAEQNIVTLARSYTQAMNVKAQEDLYRANDTIVKAEEWSAILEVGYTSTGTGTCERCAALDGNIYKLDEYRPDCPLHPRCRCFLMPVTKTWAEMGLDVPEMEKAYKPVLDAYGEAVGDGTGPPAQTLMLQGKSYESVWHQYNKARQDSTIGPVRANLVRSNTIGFKDIVDVRGNLIPINDLGIGDEDLIEARKRKVN